MSSFSSNVRHRSLERIHDFGSIQMHNNTSSQFPSNDYRLAIETVQLANRLQRMEFNNDNNNNTASSSTIAMLTQQSYLQNESFTAAAAAATAEEELIERLKYIINEFMTRPGRRYSYNTTMRWIVHDGNNQVNYGVVILINQPPNII